MQQPTLGSEARADGPVHGEHGEPWAVRAIVADAHRQAREIVSNAKAERDRIIEQARAEAAVERVRSDRSPTRPATLVHSSEISTRSFPRALRGLDPHSVYEWLCVVETSHATLEDELDRLRAAWDEILVAVGRLQLTPGSGPAGERSSTLMHLIAAGRPDHHASTLDTSAARDTLAPGQIRGVRQARAAVASARVQLARLQHRAALIQRSNEELRTQLLEILTKSCAK